MGPNKIVVTPPIGKNLYDVKDEIAAATRIFNAEEQTAMSIDAILAEITVSSSREDLVAFLSDTYPLKTLPQD